MKRIETSDGTRLGIPMGLNPRRFSSIDTVEIRKSPGIIVSPAGGTEDWYIEKFIEQDGEMVAVGRLLEGERQWNPGEDSPTLLQTLIHGIRALKAAGDPLGGLYLPAIRVLDDGKIFILPPRLEAWIRDNSSDERNHLDRDIWNHPDLKGDDAWSYTLGMIAWMMLTGEDPLRDERDEERRERIRSGTVVSIASRDGRIEPDAVRMIDRALRPGREPRPGLDEWASMLDRWIRDGIHRNIPDDEAAAIAERAGRSGEGSENQLKLRRWMRRSLRKYSLAAAILAGILIFAWAPVRKALEPPVTAGMSPIQVAETYYAAINSQDSGIMEDCLARNVGRSDRQQVDMVYVTTRVRQGYEGLAAPPSASEWLEAGRPVLPEGQWPWGIVEMELKEMPDGRVEADYIFWFPGQAADLRTAEGQRRNDVLSFTEGRRSWEISAISRSIVPSGN